MHFGTLFLLCESHQIIYGLQSLIGMKAVDTGMYYMYSPCSFHSSSDMLMLVPVSTEKESAGTKSYTNADKMAANYTDQDAFKTL